MIRIYEDDDAVEGVILMLRGEQTQNVLKAVEAKTDELNRSVLPPDVKIHPYYDRSELVELTTKTVEDNLLRGMVSGAGRSDFLPGQFSRRDYCCPDHSVISVICLHCSA